MDIDEEQQQQQQATNENDDDLLINFFPSTQLHGIASAQGTISLLVIHRMAQERIPNADEALSYIVHLVNRYGNERMGTLEFNKSYVVKKDSEEIQDALNETRLDGVERFFTLRKELRTNTIAVIMLKPCDVALLYYPFPVELFASLNYTITVYDGSDSELRTRILEYMTRVVEYNNTKRDAKLKMILPVMSGDLDDPFMVLFVAESDNKVVGYCGCVMLRYRMEIRGVLDGAIRSLERRDKTLRERFFMNETLSHIFEIKGLSVDPEMGGQNIALMLLYCAMDFMREPRVHKMYPISHVATQSASYITKRLLVTNSNFHFAYHGVNEFMNESFFETLGQEKKTVLMRVITEYIGYYRILVANRAETLSPMLHRHNSLTLTSSVYLSVIRDAIRTYQLYYLLLVTSERPGSYECFCTETLDGIVGLFTLFISTFPSASKVYLPLRNYLDRNIAALRVYRTTKVIKTLDDVVYTKGFKVIDSSFIGAYGFLTKRESGKKKLIITTAYEFIYASIANTAKLMRLLLTKQTSSPIVIEIRDEDDDDDHMKIDTNTETTKMKAYLTQIIGLTNKLVENDLRQETNYELPFNQLKKTRQSIAKLIATLKRTAFDDVSGGVRDDDDDENPRRATLQEILKSVVEKIAFLERNYAICARITNDVFNVHPDESSGFDTVISYNRLAQHWPVIESDVHKRVGYNTIATNEINDNELAMVVEEAPKLEIPDSAEKRKELIDKLYWLLVYDPPKETELFFGERLWSVAYLTEYFRDLSVVEDLSSLTETQKEEEEDDDDEMATTTTTFAYVYEYDAFNRSIEGLDDESVFNNVFI